MPVRFIPTLDGVRAIAIALVLWDHLPYVAGFPPSEMLWRAGQSAGAGYFGVDIFFVLSGFLVTRLLLAERHDTGTIGIANFYMRRTLRILPIYYLCLLAASLVAFDRASFPASLTYTFNFYHPFDFRSLPLEHTWSLCVEKQFYLVWPLLIACLPRRHGLLVTALVIPLASLAAAAVIAAHYDEATASRLIYESSLTRMMSLSAGASLAFEERAGGVRSARHCGGMLAAGAAVIASAIAARRLGVVAGGGYWCAMLVGMALVSRAVVTAVAFPATPGIAPLQRLLASAPLRYIGRISYGIYLYHQLVLHALGIPPDLTHARGASAASLLAAIALTLTLAALSYQFIERPLLELKARFRSPAPVLAEQRPRLP